MRRVRTVTMDGYPFALGGKTVALGAKAPDFTAIGLDFQSQRLSDFAGKALIICAVTSLDTPVCDTETRKFNEIAATLRDDTAILTISVDLPSAQRRWCGAAGVDNVTVLSDHREVEFGTRYGVIIPELRQLARAVFVIDKNRILRYQHLVPEIGQEPDYEGVLDAMRKVLTQ